MARYGPVTKDTTTIALGLAQVRVGPSAANLSKIIPVLTASDSVGALANTTFTGNAEYFKLESGYPLIEDATFPLREAAMIEAGFKEMTPANFALARGLDPADYSAVHTGSIPLGTIATPTMLRIELLYTYPDQTNTMHIIFPRAQVTAVIEMAYAEEEPAVVAVSIEAKNSSSDVTGGGVMWDDKPLGVILWDDGTGFTTTTTTTTTS